MFLTGRHAFVTGGGRGIGCAIGKSLAREGACVSLLSRTRSEVDAVAHEIEDLGQHALPLVADVSQSHQIKEALERARARFGPVDILVNSAGMAPSSPLVQTTDEIWTQTLAINLNGVFFCIRAVLQEMVERRWGRIITIASIAGKIGFPYIAAYATSKHGVLGLTQCAALEAAEQGVTVNAVCPGYVDTPMTDASIARIVEKTGRTPAQVRQFLENTSPQKRLFTVAEVAALSLFLCQEEARGITGQALNIDGGTMV